MSDAILEPGDAAMLSIGQCATLACLLEATIPKPGNVHRGADFEDLTFADFAAAAVAIGPAMDRAAAGAAVGATVLDAVTATKQLAATNVNLGIVLLLAPLACVPLGVPLGKGIVGVMRSLLPTDAADVYQAIRLARPGGMGRVPEADVAGPPPADLLQAMRQAADRDTIARQYVSDFADVLDRVVPELTSGLDRGWSLTAAVVRTHLTLMRDVPDTLISRKCGTDLALEAAARAGATLAAGPPDDENYLAALADFDFWLRSDGHRRNPGTTADLIAAGLFAALRDRMIPMPLKM